MVIFLSFEPMLWAWGERGHDLITRVAVRLLPSRYQAPSQFTYPFQRRELMLGHLANVPDIVWRDASMGAEVNALNEPTHYINLDALADKPSFATIPTHIKAAEELAKILGKPLEKIGTAPWRVGQLTTLMQKSFVKVVDQNKADPSKFPIDAANEALLYGGILSHFVGDLANPEHVTSDYDGYGVGQGGLHAYFETLSVEALPLSLEYEVLQYAEKTKPFTTKLLPQLPTVWGNDYGVVVALGLAINSFHDLDKLMKADKSCAFIAPSSIDSEALHKPAKRKAPKDCVSAFKPLLLQRLALGADTLAFLWLEAWKRGGSPALSDYKSFYYPVSPGFIKPEY